MKCRLMSTAGWTVDFPPPVPPPLWPNTGPSAGCLIVRTGFLPIFARPCTSPTAVVDLPSPAGVGVIAVTTISFAFSAVSGKALRGILALSLPYGSSAAGSRPMSAARSTIGRINTSDSTGSVNFAELKNTQTSEFYLP